MTEASPIYFKHIRECSFGWRVDLRKSGHSEIRDFKTRDYGSHDKALKHAIDYRDDLYRRLFGRPINDRQQHGCKRSTSKDVFLISTPLPPRMSLENPRSGIFYLVASVDGKKHRFNLKKVGVNNALKQCFSLLYLDLDSKQIEVYSKDLADLIKQP